MTSPKTKRKRLYAIVGLFAVALIPLGVALATPMECIKDGQMCNKDLLCAFKVELAEKILLYETFLGNSPATKKAKKMTRQGVKYSGALYDAALAEAKAENPGASAADLAAAAYQKFTTKVRAKLSQEASKYKDCTALGVMPNDTYRGTWSGMHTDKNDCNVYGDIGTGDAHESVALDDLKRRTEGCIEVYQSDRGHEAVHQDFCMKRLRKELPASEGLQGYIDEDIEAYRYSLQHASNDLTRLQLQCTTDPSTDQFRKRADDLLKKLKQYRINQEGQP